MLLKNDTQIYRVLKSQADKSLIIDCIKRTMPKWVSTSTLSEFEECTEMLMYETTNYPYTRQLSVDEQRIAQERFTLIAGILPFIGDEQKRSQMICFLADQCSKQTLRRYICLYLVYQDVHCLAPQPKREKSLSPDEQNMQWGLNKFYYTRQKQTLTAAYTMMLKAKYTDKDGKLLPEYPSFTQFRYCFRKTRDKKKECITRNGLKNYQRNNRPLLGDGVREYAPAVGVGMIDSTIADVFLVDDGGKLIGRPIITACVDAFSGLCLGYSIGWEGGVYSLKGLMLNIISDKKSWCQERGVFIDSEQWPCQQLPGTFCCDRGSEYISENFSNICELGPKLCALPSFRPELKSMVERWFGSLQDLYRPHLKGHGYVEKDAHERGVSDYRLDACLTLRDFERIILHCIIYLNSKRVIDFPFTDEMIADDVKPYANEIFTWGFRQLGANLIDVDARRMIQTLLPRTTGRFKRNGLNVNGMRYKQLLDKMYAEREGIVQKCVQAVQQVIASGYRFSEPDSVSVARSRYQAVNSTVISFADECLCPWPDDKINDSRCSTGTIYKVYVAWCKDNNNGFSKSAREFREELASHENKSFQEMVTRRNGNTFYKDFTLTEDAQRDYGHLLK